jgi:hypothetical protein
MTMSCGTAAVLAASGVVCRSAKRSGWPGQQLMAALPPTAPNLHKKDSFRYRFIIFLLSIQPNSFIVIPFLQPIFALSVLKNTATKLCAEL